MDQKRIRVTIDQLGKPTVEAEGFAGIGCTDATAPIERALAGAVAADRVYKPEFNNAEQTEQAVQQQQW